jgi:uncharacterized membrane protein YhaH (DUF805 family)
MLSRLWHRTWCNLFTLQGRAGRPELVPKIIMLSLVSGLLTFVVTFISMGTATMIFGFESAKHGAGIFKIIGLPFTWAIIAARVRRLHDLNFSGWWEWGFYIAIFVAVSILVYAYALHKNYPSYPLSVGAFHLAFGICILAGIVALLVMCWPGNKNENRFGPVSEI